MRLAHRFPLQAYDTPICPEAELEGWANWYRANQVDALGVRFLVFMQAPVLWGHWLRLSVPYIRPIPLKLDRPAGWRPTKLQRFWFATLVQAELGEIQGGPIVPGGSQNAPRAPLRRSIS